MYNVSPEVGRKMSKMKVSPLALRPGEEVKNIDDSSLSDQTGLLYPGLSAFDYSRLVEWMNDPNRKISHIAFTAGCARDAARAFEE